VRSAAALTCRSTFIALANERLGATKGWETARGERFYELFGIFPSLGVVRGRMLDRGRHACHAAVDDGPLDALVMRPRFDEEARAALVVRPLRRSETRRPHSRPLNGSSSVD
jgi:hypothetical protein